VRAKILGIGLVLGLAISGLALELASPVVLLPNEPLVVYTEPCESPPQLKACSAPVILEWKRTSLPDGRTRWETILSGFTPGFWEVSTNKGSVTFLLVSPLFGIVEILTQEERLVEIRTSAGETYAGWATPQNSTLFIIPYACLGPEIWPENVVQGERTFRPQKLTLFPGTRIRLFIPNVLPELSSEEVLPGSTIAIGFSAPFSALVDFLFEPNLASFSLPEGWNAFPAPMEPGCPPLHRDFIPWWVVQVGSTPGIYKLSLSLRSPENPAFAILAEAEVKVVEKLSPKVVIGHWNVQENVLDLTQPYAITYERLLWAASLMGQPIPYTDTVMTPELWQELAKEWANSSAQ